VTAAGCDVEQRISKSVGQEVYFVDVEHAAMSFMDEPAL